MSTKKTIVMDCSCYLCGQCRTPKCEGQFFVPITPEQKAKIKVADLNLGIHTATCGHKAEVWGARK